MLPTTRIPLDGSWQFRTDGSQTWRDVAVPHTWQICAESAEYYGPAWYQRKFEAPAEWAWRAVRIEFEAVFHSATVWINDQLAGEHLRKGYTAFALDIRPHLRFGQDNSVRVRVDNSFDDHMLPRGRSSDWTHDGGIIRPVSLLVTPEVFIDRVEIDAVPEPASGQAELRIRVVVRNAGMSFAEGSVSYAVVERGTGLTTLRREPAARYSVEGGESQLVELPVARMEQVKLWHFDHPHLYTLRIYLSSGHSFDQMFGVRKIETREGGFYLNAERVRLMGVERMAGSHPEYGMAEPSSWIEHDHADMKELNCVYTRVHWQQDRRVLDYCDRHGILIQTEVPVWGGQTFAGMQHEPSPDIMQNGLEQLREMIARDRNHPCIFSWGICNEINGQNPPAYAFARRMYEEAKKLDPQRLVTYASNTLQQTPEKDVAGRMDYIMWNEYYETWYGGGLEDLRRNLRAIEDAFPGKAIVISEYGWCSCTPQMQEQDARRIEVLRNHTALFREFPSIAGLIYFSYNDYRTHQTAIGSGVMKQRGGGVVDVFGNRKPSFASLRSESSPIEIFEVAGSPGALRARIRTRGTVPSYTLRGYRLRGIVFGPGDIPLELIEAPVPDLAPGQEITVPVAFQQKSPLRVQFDILRPTEFSVATFIWRI